MRAGSLRHRVTIQQATVTRDAIGGEVKTWEAVADRWASVEPLTGREFFSAQQEGAQLSARIRLRYLAGIVPTMRVVHGSAVYDVKAVVNVEGRSRELHLMVEEAVA
jgi:SPP1 family predicted phage head-tail adaptor